MAQSIFYYNNKNSKFKQLKEEEILQIINDYSNGYLVEKIMNEFPFLSRQRIRVDMPYTITDKVCEKCSEYKVKGVSKSAEDEYFCTNCKHDFTERCNCSYCAHELEQKILEKNRKYDILWEEFLIGYNAQSKDLNSLSIIDKVYLYIIIYLYDYP